MTYCIDRTNLLKQAGRELACQLLPQPFKLWYSSHDTGCQMRIVTDLPDKLGMTVWRGSIWYASCYEYNDRDDIPGLQPGFAFARDIIDGYFTALGAAVAERNTNRVIEKAVADVAAAARWETERQAAIDAVRAAITGDRADRPTGGAR